MYLSRVVGELLAYLAHTTAHCMHEELVLRVAIVAFVCIYICI